MDKSMNSLMEAKAAYERKLRELTSEFVKNELEPLWRNNNLNVSFDVRIETKTFELGYGAKVMSKLDFNVKLILE